MKDYDESQVSTMVHDRFHAAEVFRLKVLAERRKMFGDGLRALPPIFSKLQRLRPILSASSCARHCNDVAEARVDNGQQWWSPASNNNTEHMELDLGALCQVHGIGTKGRPQQRDWNTGELQQKNAREEWVSRYKLYHRMDKDNVWLLLGDFVGNRCPENENIHSFVDEHSGKVIERLEIVFAAREEVPPRSDIRCAE